MRREMPPSHDRSVALDPSRAEAWVVHAALLDRIEQQTDAGNDVQEECTLLRKVEADEYSLGTAELDVLQQALTGYLADAPPRDREPGHAVLETIRRIRQ